MVPYNLKHKNLENFEAKAYATLTSSGHSSTCVRTSDFSL